MERRLERSPWPRLVASRTEMISALSCCSTPASLALLVFLRSNWHLICSLDLTGKYLFVTWWRPLNLFFIYLTEWWTEAEVETERSVFHSLVYSSNVSNSQSWAKLKPGAWTPLRPSTWVARPNYLSHCLLYLSYISRKLELEVEPELEPKHSDTQRRHTNSVS